MNPKGEEGEFYMKKSLLVLASIMILALCTFVACTAEVSDPYDGLTYVTFGGESSTSKNLFASYEVASYDSLYWFYTAEKKDNYGTSGAVENKPVHEGHTGLNKTVGPFSQGKWKFTLSAYKNKDASANTKVYEGSVEVSLKGQKVTVPVSVTPCGGTGALEFNGVYFSWKENTASSTAIPVITIVAEGTTTGQKYTLSNSFTASEGVGTKDVKIPLVVKEKDSEGKFYIDYKDGKSPSVVADYYTSTIIAYIDDPNIPIFSQTLGFRVYGSATTVIRGNITEQSGTDVNFDPAKQDMAVFKGATTASVSVTPSGTNTTTVDFGANNLDNTSTYYLNVSATSAASAANKFTVSDSTKAPVAGIDLELVEVSSDGSNSKVRNFSGDAVTIITYIEKGLTGVTVKYNGTDGGDPVGVDYNSDTGKLMFTTNHFSEFYAVSDSVAVVLNETTEKGYARLVDAFDNSVDGCSIKLLNNIEMSSMVRITRRILVDLNGFAITTSSDFLNGAGIFTVREGGFLTIDDNSAGKKGLIENSKKAGDSNSVERYGIVVFPYKSSNEKALNHSGYAKLIVNGGTIKASYAAISGNGEFGSDTNTDIVVNDGVLEGGVTAVYHPQNGNIIVKGGSFKGNDSAIEIRAGKMTIDGGTFTANATEYSCTANGNGTTTIGASIAVAQHNTKLPIDVVINGASILKGVYGLSVTNPQGNSKDAISKVKVTINNETENLYVSTDFIREENVIRAKTTEEDSEYVACLSTGFNFISLKDAVKAVTDSGYITLLQDVKDGDGILIPAGNRSITVDFNDKLYVVTKNFVETGYNNKLAFKLEKGNDVILKQGTIKTTKADKFIENYCNLTLDSINLDCSSYAVTYVLSCNYGTTLITGTTNISNLVYSNGEYICRAQNAALRIYNSFSDLYKEGVSVKFDEYFTGKVTGYIGFELDNTNRYDGTEYKHSLIIEGSGDFSTAQFCFSRVGCKSSFRMNGSPNLYEYSFYPTTTDSSTGTTALDFGKAVVLNKTTDAVYEELPRAMNDASTKFENELVLKGNCIIKYLIKQPCGKNLKLDLNGYSITPSEDFDDTCDYNKTEHVYALLRVDDGTLTIKNSGGEKGSIDSTINSSLKYGIKVINGGTLIVNGATIKGKDAPTLKDDSSTVKIN